MRATEFEFHYRFWFICLVYVLGFEIYTFDHMNAAAALVHWVVSQGGPHLHGLAAKPVLRGLFALSAALMFAAAWLRTWGGAYLRTEVVHDSAVHTERLVADGPYRHLRNPLYFGNMLMAIAFAMLASRAGGVIMILGNLLIVLRLIGREEAALMQAQGEGYRAFLAAVPRLWPSLRPRLPAGGMEPKWVRAFLGEGWVWIFALDGFIFAWRLDFHLYITLLWCCAGTYRLLWALLERLRKPKLPSSVSGLPAPPSA